ncbi:T-cell surface glycoprotein CD3 epsilon chain isoform X2 [Tachyglossus aculeatus]|uniref:T-cell surface glycoprotein CD3 epsilon chain isoform X2 n=1 Tax=Tachyglossus aculeatus TaxID=9261 RepID=UPI0018F6BD5E|nr:T-cell surface glycoprotein CD3 epsilon chain isoform X2 [Tachyglossus aculeatus]
MGPRTFWAVLGIWLMAARGVWSQEGDELGEEKNTVCEMCVEVDLLSVAGIVVGDVLVTLGVLVLVYYWSKSRKGQATGRGAGTTGRPRGPTKERPPPVPSPDYEPIRKGQRDVYSGLNQRGI